MFNEVYNDWNHKRSKAIIDYYGYKFFYGKKVLDLGAGQGEIAASLSRLGADVLCVDARQENLDAIKKKHSMLRTMRLDLENEWPFGVNEFDIVLSIGLVCHIRTYDKHIRQICSVAENIILESEVLDTNDINAKTPIYEEKTINDLSFHGEGLIVPAVSIQNILSDVGATVKRLDDSKLNSGPYKYDWKHTNIGRRFGLRRMWFIRADKYYLKMVAHQSNIQKAEGQLNYVPPPQERIDPVAHKRNTRPVQLINNNQIFDVHNVIETDVQEKYFLHKPTVLEKEKSIIRLFINQSSIKITKEDLNFFIEKNKENNLLTIQLIDNPSATFEYLFLKINEVTGPDDINIISNIGTFFDETIALANNINNKQVYALTSWYEPGNDGAFKNLMDSQDAWIIRGKISNVNGSFPLGEVGADSRIAYEFHKAGYSVINPSKSIKIYNKYDPNTYSSNSVPGPHLFILPSSF